MLKLSLSLLQTRNSTEIIGIQHFKWLQKGKQSHASMAENINKIWRLWKRLGHDSTHCH